jgi:O-antigen/teichoic acid export membrane protein
VSEPAVEASVPAASPEPAAGSASSGGAQTGRRTLREQAVRSGAYMATREAAGMLVRLAGVTLVVRLIGPGSYGIYAGAAAFVAVAALTAQGGVEVFLIRQQDEPEPLLYSQAFSYLLAASLGVTAVSIGLSFVAGAFIHIPRALDVFRVLVLTVPVNVLWAPAQAAIERRFDFRLMGTIEVIGDVVLYAVAVPLAFAGLGPWCLVAGFAAWQSWLFVASLVSSGLRLRPAWSAATARRLAANGVSYAGKDWIDSIGGLVVPVVVGGFCGAAGVGLVSFGARLVDTAAFAQRSGWRVGLVSMSSVREPDRLRRGLEEGSLLQFLVLGAPIAGLALTARWLVPLVFGASWSPAIAVTALIGLSVLLRGPGDIQATLLFSRGRNVAVTTSAAIRQVAIVAVAVTLVPLIGIDGYGIASLAALAGVWYTRRVVRREIVPFGYGQLAPFAAAFVPLVLFPIVPLPWCLATLAPACWVAALPRPRQAVLRTYRSVRHSLRRSAAAGDAAPASPA